MLSTITKVFTFLPLTICAALLAALPLHAVTLVTYDFETDDNGLILVNGQHISTGVGVQPDTVFEFGHFSNVSSLVSAGGHEGIAIFDSDPNGPNSGSSDPDLLVNTGNILILQENPGTSSGANGTVFNMPNDQAANDAGSLVFDFLTSFAEPLSIDIIDANGGFLSEVILTDQAGKTRTYTIPAMWTKDVNVSPGAGNGIETLDLTITTAQLGENAGIFATAAEDLGYNGTKVDTLEVKFIGISTTSGGIDNLLFNIPEPTTLVLIILGALAPLPILRRRAQKS